MHTFATALDLIDTTVPAHLVADAEVPVLTGPQTQGDLMVVPLPANTIVGDELGLVPSAGIQVVVGEATGNTHWLHQGLGCTGVKWYRISNGDDGVVIGYVLVPAGESALLLHTDEHGANGIGAGVYAIHGKREQADVIRRVAD